MIARHIVYILFLAKITKLTIMCYTMIYLLHTEHMIRISEIIAEIVEGQPFLEDALRHGYLNLTGFAEYIRPYVEERVGKPLSAHAIKMALSRMDHPEHLAPYGIRWTHNQISTITGLILTSIVKSPGMQEAV